MYDQNIIVNTSMKWEFHLFELRVDELIPHKLYKYRSSCTIEKSSSCHKFLSVFLTEMSPL